MRIPEPGPFGETFFDARVRAMVAALWLNSPSGGWVESVVTAADQRLGFAVFLVAAFLVTVFLAGICRSSRPELGSNSRHACCLVGNIPHCGIALKGGKSY